MKIHFLGIIIIKKPFISGVYEVCIVQFLVEL